MSGSNMDDSISTRCFRSVRRHWVAFGILGLLAVAGTIKSFVSQRADSNDEYFVVSTPLLNANTTTLPGIMTGVKNKTRTIQKFDSEMLAKAEIIRMKSNIFQFWDIRDYPKFLETMHIPDDSWLTFKYKFVDLIMNSKEDNTTSFVIGFSGSSVTAGHDNFINESYPAVVERTLRPVFSRLGIGLDVRNAAMGNNPCYPYDLCLGTHLGNDVDVISWEQSMNCGRNSDPVESFIRASANMAKKPMVFFMSSGTPFWPASSCPNSQPRYSNWDLMHGAKYNRSTPLTPVEKDALRKPLNVIANSSAHIIDLMPFLTVKGTKYDGWNLADYYKGYVPVCMQSVSGPITEYQCQGPYGADFCRKTMGKGKDWHPGVMGHKYRADSFSYFVLEILKQAVSMVAMAQMRGKKDLSALHDEAHHFLNHHLYRGNFSAKKSTDHHKFALPQPLMCSNAVCKKDWSCYTNFEPRKANNFSLGLRVVGGSIPTGWTRNLSWFDVAGVAKARSENRGYSDLKFIFITNVRGEGPLEDKDGGVLTLDVVPRSNSSIWLCQVQRGFAKYSGDKGTLDVDASVAITLNVPESVKREDPFASGKKGKRLTLSPVQDECFETEPVPAGRHFLSIWPKLRSKQVDTLLSHCLNTPRC